MGRVLCIADLWICYCAGVFCSREQDRGTIDLDRIAVTASCEYHPCCQAIPLTFVQLGPENAQALTTTFGVFYRVGLSISMLLRDNRLLSANNGIRSEVNQILNTLLILVRDVSLFYNLKLRTSATGSSFDFNGVFGPQIAYFHKRKNYAVDAMWEYSLGKEATVETRSLRKWLGSGKSGIDKLRGADDMAPASRDEFTCEWLQSHLLAFSRSQDDVFAIYGPGGCGKSVLASWITERLQRPLGKKSCVTLSCVIGMPLSLPYYFNPWPELPWLVLAPRWS